MGLDLARNDRYLNSDEVTSIVVGEGMVVHLALQFVHVIMGVTGTKCLRPQASGGFTYSSPTMDL